MTTPRNISSWLPNLIGPLDVQADGESVTIRRATLNFIGATVTDDPDNARTDIDITGAVGPEGPQGEQGEQGETGAPGSAQSVTGTGFWRSVSGSLQAASAVIDLAGGATYITGTLPVGNGGTGITSLGTGVATFLGTPTTANLLAAVTGETGSGAVVFGTAPTIASPLISSPTFSGTPIYQGTRFSIRSVVGEVQTSSTSATTVASFTMTDDTHAQFDAIVTFARQTSVTKAGTYKLSVGYRRAAGGAPTIVGALVQPTDQETTAGDTVTIDVSSNDVRVRVTAADSDTRNWSCELRVQETLDT